MQRIISQIVFFIVLASFYSCKGQNAQLQCYFEALNNVKKKPVYATVHSALIDTLSAWTERKLKGVRSLKHYDWKIDEAVFFNKSEDKAILLILERDTQKIVKFGNNDYHAPTQDQIETVFAYVENGRWQFYTYTMPVMAILRANYGKSDAMTFEELSEIGRKEVLRSYYKNHSCEINPVSFEVDKNLLKNNHSKFLDNSSAIYEGIKDKP